MRKTIALLLTMVLIAMAFTAYADDKIKVSVNGTEIDFSAYDNVLPYIENDRTLVPIRAIAESMDFSVDWEDLSRTVTVKNNNTEIVLVIDSDKATVNNETYTLDVPARITNDRTFIPLRFISENMGATVNWNGADRSVTITKDNTLAKIDNTKWQFDEDNNVYWQTGISYCATPADTAYETLGIYVPSAYMTASDNGDGTYTCEINNSGAINGYTAKTAPIVIPINTPGYSAMNPPSGYDSSTAVYTDAGFVYVYAGARGRNEGAPAGVTDFKAAIRYIRYNQDVLAGDKDSIFSFGMSGGGAQSALIGTTGNSELYTPYLNAIGAADEKDDVKGSMCWCPITNLDIANEAYEWNMGVTRSDLDDTTATLSNGLKDAFADYINEIQLTDSNGTVLLLEQDENGDWTKGTYYEYVKSKIERSLNNFLADTTFPYTKQASKGFGGMMGGGFGGQQPDFANGEKPGGMDTENLPIEAVDGISRNTNNTQTTQEDKTYQTAEEYIADLNGDSAWIVYDKNTNTAKITSIEAFVKACKNASKSVGAFDDLNASQGENTLFGYGDGKGAHFDPIMAKLLEGTDYADSYNSDLLKTDALGNSVAYRLNMYTPMYYIDDMYDGYKTSDVAKYFRIRTGINQGDTALSTEINLALALSKYGSDVDFEMVWGQGHTKAERGDQTENSSDKNFIEWVNACMK
ncbi:MAG: copper amine oxidase N-terminal domain-containing protein [Clostridia bacterium]|nr:copper amine oxidase N-terminal domain-containing protein [Clostridia bacterium]